MTTSADAPKKLSRVETIKERSNFLREPIATEINQDTTHFSEDGVQILKFHGSYQQDNRDNRKKGQEKDYQFMLRTRTPAGYVPPQLYLTLDRLATDYGNNTIRATTRQGFQLHGVLKKNLKTVIATIIRNMGSTLGACGDVNRNVMAPPAPYKNRPEYQYAWEYAQKVADLLTPQTGAYYEIWLDGEKIITAEEAPEVKAARLKNTNGTIFPDSPEPIYGTNYMPRKFKCAVTVPGDNSVDIYTHDLGLVVITDEHGKLQGFNVLAGGGLGRTHRKEETFPRLADEIGYVDKEDIFELVKAVVATQRDYGNRSDRRRARLKYLIHDWGVDRFRQKVQEYFGKPLQPFKPLPPWRYKDYLGWHEQGDGKLFFGLSIENGRIKNDGGSRLKDALREVIGKYQLPSRVTPHQNLILYDIQPEWQQDIEAIFQQHGVEVNPDKVNHLTRYAMACPALPTCGLAITESERVFPSVLARIDALLAKLGMAEETFVIRMTGCPNGCARPYMAELGFVGESPDVYQVWLGGNPHQTRLASPYLDKLNIADLESFLEPLLVYFRDYKQPGETFGEFCHRVGFDSLRQFASKYQPKSDNTGKKTDRKTRSRRQEHRISVSEFWYQKLKAISQAEKKPMSQIVAAALEKYFGSEK
ncbi:MAG: sulfite reductase, ferredoxin dependent [Geminocystis sp.]|nr:sulfite reductase, ferredoxin dependent [Geminocystis sp.]MCS7148539.1 sulfite reductase, ferredoxin dependent [Geminocystis sp.]MDW8114888.1 sulfite reductase, ferredoxin dependent [Geminocystis sp.]MDW8464154.1 sulfite reductase, ferredoxin dependent [Geminocystis sp.]